MNVLEMQQDILIMAFAGLVWSYFPQKIYTLIRFSLLLSHLFLELDSLYLLIS